MASSTSSGKARAVEVVDEPNHSGSDSEGSDDENNADHDLPEASSPSTSSKKKKKKRSKALKALNALRGKDNIPDDLVKVVLEKVKEQGSAPEADEATVRAALEQMKIKDVIKGKTGLGGKNLKETGGHKVRKTTLLQRTSTHSSSYQVLGNPARTTNRYAHSNSHCSK